MKKSRLNVALCGLVTATVLTLNACTSITGTQVSSAQAFGALNQNTLAYENLVNDANNDSRFEAQILLMRSYVNAGDAKKASALLSELKSNAVTPIQKAESSMMEALLLSRTGNAQEALKKLSGINPNALPQSAFSYFYQLKSSINSRLFNNTKNSIFAFAAYDSDKLLIDYVKGQDKITLINRCNEILAKISDQDLAKKLQETQDYNDRGFFEYAMINRSSSDKLKTVALKDFAKKYSQHPLNLVINFDNKLQEKSVSIDLKSQYNKEDAKAANINPKAIFSLKDNDKIAVLLPLSGRFAENVGKPARLGILAALSERNSNVKAIFYDTNQKNISEIVKNINTDGTALVIGPILKPELNAFNSFNIKVPSIALNVPEGKKPENQWYFDLGPDYEGAIAASKIYADNYRKPIIIASEKDQSAQRATASFKQAFANVIKPYVCTYQDPTFLKQALQNCPFNKADSVYIHAPANDSVTIKVIVPTNLPVYLTNKSYIGVNNSAQELALKGSTLGDMPWLLTNSPLKESFMQTLPKANAQVQRIFAASYDAIGFAFNLEKLSQDSRDVMHGLSGDLSLTNKGLIETSPMWVKLGDIRAQ